jgi:hypothetical protein
LIAAGDLDHDGDPDLAVTNWADNTVSILINDGSGTFAPPTDYIVGDSPYAIVAADLDGDGDLDLAVTNLTAFDAVSILLNNGDATFAPGADLPVARLPDAVSAGDLDGDGDIDLAATNISSASVSVLMNLGNAVFAPAVDHATREHPYDSHMADFDGDGDLDVMALSYVDDCICLFLNDGSGSLAPCRAFQVGASPVWAAVADYDADGRPDVAVSNPGSRNVSVHLNDTLPAVSADENGNGIPDECEGNDRPIADAGGPYAAWATSATGASVPLYGSASSDPDGDPLTFAWDLDCSADSDGDGHPANDVDTTGVTPTATFPFGATTISLIVTDTSGLSSEPDFATVTVSIVQATLRLVPRTLNLKSQGAVVTCHIEPPEGYDAEDIDVASLRLNGAVEALVQPTSTCDCDDDGLLDLVVKFSRGEVGQILEVGDSVPISVTGLVAGRFFEATDRIRVTNPGIGDRHVRVRRRLQFRIAALAEGLAGPVTFSAHNLPPGASLDPMTGDFSWTPTDKQGGAIFDNVAFLAADGQDVILDTIVLSVSMPTAVRNGIWRHYR